MKRPRSQMADSPNLVPIGFFDKLPSDALLTIIHSLSIESAPNPSRCPLLTLSRVSLHARSLIASTIGKRLAFSVHGNSDWFHHWLALSAPFLEKLSLHDRSYRTAGEIRHTYSKWPSRPSTKLNACRALTTIYDACPPLVELDISGLAPFRRAAAHVLERLLIRVRMSLRVFRVDLRYVRVAGAVARARLNGLRKLAVVNVDARCEGEVMVVLRSLKREGKKECGLRELILDACDRIPEFFLEFQNEMRGLLVELEAFSIDYDDDLQDAMPISDVEMNKIRAAVSLGNLKRICFSGSGLLITREVVEGILEQCTNLTDLRLMDCDVDPSERSNGNGLGKSCDNALISVGTLLTRYYPRWLTFKLEQLELLGMYCKKLTHLRVFTAPRCEQALINLGEALRGSLVDLEVYPKMHEKKREVAGAVVQMVQRLEKVERLCLVTLEISTMQLKEILRHCGNGLKAFSFSPPCFHGKTADETGACVAEVISFAAGHNTNLQRLECIFRDDRVPVIRSSDVARRVKLAVSLLESRARQLESGSIVAVAKEMIAKVDGFQI